jgi:hypothetical protein
MHPGRNSSGIEELVCARTNEGFEDAHLPDYGFRVRDFLRLFLNGSSLRVHSLAIHGIGSSRAIYLEHSGPVLIIHQSALWIL